MLGTCRRGVDGGRELLLRIDVGSIAGGLAAFAIGFISYFWATLDTETANGGWRAETRNPSISGAIHPKRVDRGPRTDVSDIGDNGRAHLASLQTGAVSASSLNDPDSRSEPPSARTPFGERFSFDHPSAPSSFLQPSRLSASFDDRFGDALGASTAVRSAAAPPYTAVAPVAAAVPMPRPAPRAGGAQSTPKRPSESQFQLASASETPVSLAYAPSDPSVKDLAPKDSDLPVEVDTTRTAIYDIAARTVYLPNGRRLEAHSGLGRHMDDPRYVNVRMTGPTPPNVYDLKFRERLFHGVRAIRLIPTDSSKMYGRAGILAHSYMLGPNGQSNGCVSFKDYAAFLDAFERGEINRLVVVERLADAPAPKTAADWLSNKLKDLFRRS